MTAFYEMNHFYSDATQYSKPNASFYDLVRTAEGVNARVFVERLDNLLSCVEYLSKASPNAQPDMQFMKNFFDIDDRKKMKEADHQTIVDVTVRRRTYYHCRDEIRGHYSQST